MRFVFKLNWTLHNPYGVGNGFQGVVDVIQGLDYGVHVVDDLVSWALVEVEIDPAAEHRENHTRSNKDTAFQRPLTHSGQY